MDSSWTRRKFLSRAAGSAVSLASAPPGRSVLAYGAGKSALQGRFVTHVSVVRVNQIEVTPDRSIGEDEAPDDSPDHIRSRRETFARGCPDGRMTWAIGWLTLNDTRQEYKDARRLLASYHERFGDESPSFPAAISRLCMTPENTSE
jgi:hypothetical protein